MPAAEFALIKQLYYVVRLTFRIQLDMPLDNMPRFPQKGFIPFRIFHISPVLFFSRAILSYAQGQINKSILNIVE